MLVIYHWPIHQLDIKNALLLGEQQEEVYIKQPPSFTVSGDSRLVCRLCRSLYGLKQSTLPCSSLTWLAMKMITQCFIVTLSSLCIYLIVYIDDIVITSDDSAKIHNQFQTKDLGSLKYPLGIEIVQSLSDIVVSQWKYALNILTETSMLDCRPNNTPMDSTAKLLLGQGGH